MRSQDIKDPVNKKDLSEETWRELRKKKLCFSCKDSWERGHRCMSKCKVHYIKVVSDDKDDDGDEGIG